MDEHIMRAIIFLSGSTLALLILALINDKLRELRDVRINQSVSDKKYVLIAGNDPRFSEEKKSNNPGVTGL